MFRILCARRVAVMQCRRGAVRAPCPRHAYQRAGSFTQLPCYAKSSGAGLPAATGVVDVCSTASAVECHVEVRQRFCLRLFRRQREVIAAAACFRRAAFAC